MATTINVLSRRSGVGELNISIPDAIVLQGNDFDQFAEEWWDYYTSKRVPFDNLPSEVQEYFIDNYFSGFYKSPTSSDALQIYLLPANGKTFEQLNKESYFTAVVYKGLVDIEGTEYYVFLPYD